MLWWQSRDKYFRADPSRFISLAPYSAEEERNKNKKKEEFVGFPVPNSTPTSLLTLSLTLTLTLLAGQVDDGPAVVRRDAAPAREAVVAELAVLEPGLPQHLDTVALVVRVVAGEVAVRLEPQRRVVADEEELFPVAHLFFTLFLSFFGLSSVLCCCSLLFFPLSCLVQVLSFLVRISSSTDGARARTRGIGLK
ncbi:hypothetical protein F5Y17DRAFT_438014 [Xylariaceae sp. FL0594]|nr:hypothetical protein F5Y17DRAFT_438014 [Xylariaceae sp. FL0594]